MHMCCVAFATACISCCVVLCAVRCKPSSHCSEFQDDLAAVIEQLNRADLDGTSLLDIQRGIFVLLQGAAYRV